MSRAKESRKLWIVTLSAMLVIFLGMVFYHFVEGFSWVDAFYFCVTTLSTVGYGDIHPVTDIGKIFTGLYIFTGIGFLLAFADVFTDRIMRKRQSFYSKFFHKK